MADPQCMTLERARLLAEAGLHLARVLVEDGGRCPRCWADLDEDEPHEEECEVWAVLQEAASVPATVEVDP